MIKNLNPLYRIVSVLVALGFFSLACGLGSSIAPTATASPSATAKPSDIPILDTGSTATPAEQGDKMATPDLQVTQAETLAGMIDNMMVDPKLAYSNADDVLKRDVLKTLVDNTYQDGCTYGFSKVTITKAPKTDQSGWVEEWVMSICDKATTLQITFTPSPDGGTDYVIHKK